MKVFFGVLGIACLAAIAVTTSKPTPQIVLSGFSTSLNGRSPNQRHNAILSMSKLQSVKLKPGATFSFNGLVGTFTRDQGYRRAPVSYNGNLISSWGGGVCQTSTTVYNAALLAGLTIEERHRHRFAPSYVAPGRDAAVAFNTIDLKIKNPYPFDIELRGRVVGDRLEVVFVGTKPLPNQVQVYGKIVESSSPSTITLGNGDSRKLRNTGKQGFEVAIYRQWPGLRERVSYDRYPAMDRVEQYYDR